jgi:nitrate/TMAO reductase-like tetraheme cytochrome c subunit
MSFTATCSARAPGETQVTSPPDEKGPADHEGAPTASERSGFGAWLWRRPQRWFLLGIPLGGLLAFVIGVGATGGFLSGLKFAESTAFCTSCHEMRAAFDEYTQSVHYSNEFGIRAGCGNCHVPPSFFAGLYRHVQASGEIFGHLSGKLGTPAKYEAQRAAMAQKIWAEFKANDSAECRSCHTPSAMATAKQPEMAAEAHRSLAKSGMTCIDCHQGVAHKLPAGS